MKKVSCIICAFNEGPRISNILKVITKNQLIDEIIVVNDSSSDNTEEEVLKFEKVKLINHKKNLGKAPSMLDGCNNAKNDLVMFLDADLIGLTSDNITRLVKPVLNGSIDMTISICKYDFIILDALNNLLGVEITNGERVINKEIAKNVLKNSIGYNAEIQMNQYFLDNNLKFLVINWFNVKAPLKREKHGIKKGFFETIVGLKHLINNVSLTQIIKQMLIMGKLSNKYKRELNISI